MINNDWQQKKCLTFEEKQFEGKDCLFVSYFYLFSFSFWASFKDEKAKKNQTVAAVWRCSDASVHRLVGWNKWICVCFDYRLDIFQAKAPNVCSFQLLKSEHLLLLFVTPDSKERIWFDFWIVDPTKRDIFLFFLTFYSLRKYSLMHLLNFLKTFFAVKHFPALKTKDETWSPQ